MIQLNSGILPSFAAISLSSPQTLDLKIGGVVLGPQKKPIANATIIAKAPFHETALAVTSSDIEGKFSFNLPAGTYMLTATTPTLNAAVLPFKEYLTDNTNLVLEVDTMQGFTIQGKVIAPPDMLTSHSYIILNHLKSLVTTIFYTPVKSDGSFRAMAPLGEEYRVDLDSLGLKAVPVMTPKITIPGQIVNCTIEAQALNQAPEHVVSWIKENCIPISSPDPRNGYADLLPLKNIIGKARVVAIGENTHGTKEFFQMKHKFLEFLVEEMGFSVFVMEGVDISDNTINDYILNCTGDAENLPQALPSVWHTDEIVNMLKWMREYNANPAHARKIKFYGVENGDPESFSQYVQHFLSKIDPEALDENKSTLSLFEKKEVANILVKYSQKEYTALEEILNKLSIRFENKKLTYTKESSVTEYKKALFYVRLLKQFAESCYVPGENDYHYLNLRARDMADSIKWILDVEPVGTRIMFWAHNFHHSLSPYPGYPFKFSGMLLKEMLKNDYFSIGFIFNSGGFLAVDYTTANRANYVVKSFTVGPFPGSFGAAMSRTRLPYFFLDLRNIPSHGEVGDWFSKPHIFPWVNYIFDSEKDITYLFQLPRLFDAVIFIDKVTSATPFLPKETPQVHN